MLGHLQVQEACKCGLWMAICLDTSSTIREGKKNEHAVYTFGHPNTRAHVSSSAHTTLVSRLLIYCPVDRLHWLDCIAEHLET